MENIFKIIIAGGRDFNNYELLKRMMDIILKDIKNTHKIIIISGKANGADKLGEIYAEEKGYEIDPYPALWNDIETDEPCRIKTRKDGSSFNVLAGLNRNKHMAEVANALVAFHDGESTGTKNMIELAKEYKLLYRVIDYYGNSRERN